jgi:hypothetical protein
MVRAKRIAMKTARRAVVAGLIFLISLCAGCSQWEMRDAMASLTGGEVDRPASEYVRGTLRAEKVFDLERIYKAAQSVLAKGGYVIRTEDYNSLESRIEAWVPAAKASAGRTIVLNITREYNGRTLLTIRVGVWGDKDLSMEILSAIDKTL